MSPALRKHEALKLVRGRGAETQPHRAAERYLRGLEAEMDLVMQHIAESWRHFDDAQDFRRCMKAADHAQQRIHRALQKIARWSRNR